MNGPVKRTLNSSEVMNKVVSSEMVTCEICNVDCPNQPSYFQHISGGRHKKLYKVLEDQGSINMKCGLYIRGYSINLGQDGFIKYFSRYGTIVWYHLGQDYLLLDYKHPQSAEAVLKARHYRLSIKYRQPRPKINKDDEDPMASKLGSLRNLEDLNKQIEILITSLQGEVPQQFPKYSKICSDLHNILIRFYPHCQIYPFGSTITGLGFKNSDIDIYIAGIKQFSNDIPYLYKIKSILFNSQIFTSIIVIAHAKIPILKCIHKETSISCDINLRNMLGACNSNLIKYYLDLSPNIKSLLIILKYWAKVHKLTGQSHLFTNYSLSLMVIFLLQQRPYEAPSVLELQRKPIYDNIQEHWNGGFECLSFFSTALANTSLMQLLTHFFSFYSDFEYGVNVICPYVGHVIKKDDFNTPTDLSVDFKAYKAYVKTKDSQPFKTQMSICIQDPFEHCRNTVAAVSDTVLQTFVSFCRLGKNMCERGETGLLYRLFTEVPENTMSKFDEKSNCLQFSILEGPSLKYLDKNVATDDINRKQALHNAWFDTVHKFILKVLKDILKFEVEEVQEQTSTKNMKNEGQTDVYDKNKQNISYHCSAKLNLWNARKSTLKDLSDIQKDSGIIEKELAVTEKLCDLYKKLQLKDNIVKFEIYLEFRLDPAQTVIRIKKLLSYKKSFADFITFFKVKLQTWFNTYERELNTV